MPSSLPPTLADAHDTNYAEFSTGYAKRAGAELRRDALVDRAIVDLPALEFNGVFRSKLPRADVAPIAEETLAIARAHRVPVAWRVTPTTPPETAPALEAIGWHAGRQVPIMARDLGIQANSVGLRTGVTVEEVASSTLADWSRVVALSFGCPEDYVHVPAGYDRDFGLPGETTLCRFLLRIDGEPVASSALLPGPAGTGLAGIFCVGTLERSRGQGLGTAMTQAAMTAARDMGAQVVVLQASEMGQPVYERLGFDTVGHIAVHLPPEH
ncbi:MAG TPA: GNAT family N-acetyltransferase [Acidimicrobiales bacterium]|nr:GNAT family N-acetyltransferase [Acidimicrobiales bacterium]